MPQYVLDHHPRGVRSSHNNNNTNAQTGNYLLCVGIRLYLQNNIYLRDVYIEIVRTCYYKYNPESI